MSAGWQVGDLALCVNAGRIKLASGILCHVTDDPVIEGRVYTVIGFDVSTRTGSPLLCLEGMVFGRLVERFRKIRPDEREACEPEFVTLLNRIKRKIGAAA